MRAVELCWKTEVEFPGIRFLGIYAPLSAVFKVFINGGMKAFYGFRNRFPVKTYNVSGIDDPADKDAVIQVRLNARDISLICNGIHRMFPVRKEVKSAVNPCLKM